jgi:O-antigen/teichoic acid export membrane protein
VAKDRAKESKRRPAVSAAPAVSRPDTEAEAEARTAVSGQRTAASATAVLERTARLPDYGDEAERVTVSVYDVLAPEGATDLRRSSVDQGGISDGVTARSAAGEPGPPAPAPTATETAMRGLFGRDSIYLLVAAAQAGLAALSIPITTRLLGGEQFAVVTTSIAVMQVLVAIGVFSLPTAIQRNYRDEDAGRDARRTVSLAIITAAITLVIVFATGSLWAPALSLGSFGPVLRYAVIWASLTAVTFAAVALLRSRNLLRLYALVSFIQSVVAEIFSVLLVVFIHRSAAEFIFGEMLMQAVAAALALAAARPLLLRRRDRRLVLGSLKYSGALVPAAIAGFLLTTSDRLVIRHDLPILQVARYGAVYNIASIPILLLGLLDTVWLPRFFGLTDAKVRAALLADSRDALYRILIPTLLGLGFSIPLVLSVWVPANYHAAGLVIVVVTISAGAFPMAGYISSNRVLLISGRTVPVGLCMIVTAAFNIAANIVLVPQIGIEGSALSTSLAFLVLQVLVTIFAHRVQHLRPPPVGLLAGAALAVSVAVSCTVVPSTGVFAALRVLLTLVCLLVVASLLRDVIAPGQARWLPRASRAGMRR